MDDENDISDLNYSESLSDCSLYLLPGRLCVLVILKPEEWAISFKSFEKRIYKFIHIF